MKRQFLAIPILFILFSLLFIAPSKVLATDCIPQGGTCGFFPTCANGPPISATDCPFPNRCCPVSTNNSTTKDCLTTSGKEGVNTALGCIDVGSGESLVTTILKIATGLGGGLALALILYGVFIVTTSAGMPDKLKAGSEIITSAVIGLIFILLSVFLVNLIGINILGIPGLS